MTEQNFIVPVISGLKSTVPARPSYGAYLVRWRVFFSGTVLVFVLGAAWLSDDSLISLRTVENLFSGEGLRWNGDERTMTYSHPLWLLLLCIGRALSGELYFSAIALGLLCTTVATAMLLMLVRAPCLMACVVALLVSSRAFVDFGTSGLENPLVHVLLLALVARASRPREVSALGRTTLFAALTFLTRHDLALLCLPICVWRATGESRRAIWWGVLVAAIPIAAWWVFAIVYYGTIWPTTAYGKLIALGASPLELVPAGLNYCLHLVRHDPVTAAVIVAGVVIGIAWRKSGTMAIAVGCLLQMVYIIKIGGDFMAGRFWSPIFVCSMATIVIYLRASVRARRYWLVLTVCAGALTCLPGIPSQFQPWKSPTLSQEGAVADERAGYHRLLGLWSPSRMAIQPGVLEPILAFTGPENAPVALTLAAGWLGVMGGAQLHVVDPYICDPLLTRLPFCRALGYRTGHYTRRIPAGYLEALAHGDSALMHPGLRSYYDALRQSMRGDIWSMSRWSAVWNVAIGTYDQGLRDFLATDYEKPPLRTVRYSDLPGQLELDRPWFLQPKAIVVYDGGVRILLPAVGTGSLEMALQLHDEYEITLRSKDEQVSVVVDTGLASADLVMGFASGFIWKAVDAGKKPWESVDVRVRRAIDLVGVVAGLRVAR